MSNQQKVYSFLSIVDFVCAYFSFNYSIYDFCQGFLPVIQDLLPGAVQRFCVQYLYSNFKRKKKPSKSLKSLVWRETNSIYPKHGRGR